MQQQEEKVFVSANEIIQMQLGTLKENQRELKNELRDLRQELKDTRKELNGRIDKLEDKIDRLAAKIDTTTNHGQIATISTGGIAIAVIYSLLK